MHTQKDHSLVRLSCWLTLALFVFCSMAASAKAQRMVPERGRVPPASARVELSFSSPRPTPGSQSNAVNLVTDSEVERLLGRTQQYIDDGRFDLAVVLAQKILDERGSLQLTRSDANYRWYANTHRSVEAVLQKLPASGLAAYRLTADAEAKGLLGNQQADREALLAELVKRFFMSSYGDDAAFELSGLLLDRHQFVAASRLLDKIRTQHPDPSIPREQLLIRQIIAATGLHDLRLAKVLYQELNASSQAIPRSVLEALDQELNSRGLQPFVADTSSQSWGMAFGNAARRGIQPSLPDTVLQRPLIVDPQWGTKLLALPEAPDFSSLLGNQIPIMLQEVGREDLVAEWISSGRTPTAQMFAVENRVYLKNYAPTAISYLPATDNLSDDVADLVTLRGSEEVVSSYSGETGELIFKTRPAPLRTNLRVSLQSARRGATLNFEEALLFKDHTNQLLSIIDGTIYVVEGIHAKPVSPEAQTSMLRQGLLVLGTESNGLSGFTDPSHTTHPSEGKLRWSPDNLGWMEDVQFLSAPVPYQDRVALIGRHGRALHLFLVSPVNGTISDRIFLCPEPAQAINSNYTPVGVAVDGDDLYIATGYGLVLAFDIRDQSIIWAVQYKRSADSGRPSLAAGGGPLGSGMAMAQALADNDAKSQGENTVISCGRTLIVFPSDSDHILAFDRRNGNEAWVSPKNTFDGGTAQYPLGVLNDCLYLAGNDVVRCIRLHGGSIVWEQKLDHSLGRGILTQSAIFVPDRDSIVQLNPVSGQRLARVLVTLPDHDPVGNLFSDGKRLYVFGLDRLHGLTIKPTEALKDETENSVEPAASDATADAV